MNVSLEYTRKVSPMGEAAARPGAEERIMSFATVTVAEDQKVGPRGERGRTTGSGGLGCLHASA